MYIVFRNKIPPKKNSRRLTLKKSSLTSLPSEKYEKWNKYIKNNKEKIIYFDQYEIDDFSFYTKKTNLYFKAIFFPYDYSRFDLTNIVQSIEDTLQDIKVISDDNFKILSNFNYKVDYSNIWIDKNIFAIIQISEKEEYWFDKLYNLYEKKIYNDIPIFEYVWKKKLKKQNKPKILYEPEF